jgi:hypothetical protein
MIQGSKETPFRILLTGFGAHAGVPDGRNPAWLVASSLDGIFLQQHPLPNAESGKERPVLISCLTRPFQSHYAEVLDLVPRLHEMPYDAIVHLGWASLACQ